VRGVRRYEESVLRFRAQDAGRSAPGAPSRCPGGESPNCEEEILRVRKQLFYARASQVTISDERAFVSNAPVLLPPFVVPSTGSHPVVFHRLYCRTVPVSPH